MGNPRGVGLPAVGGTVERADRRAEDTVGPDAAVDQFAQHADLRRAATSSTGQHEGGARRYWRRRPVTQPAPERLSRRRTKRGTRESAPARTVLGIGGLRRFVERADVAHVPGPSELTPRGFWPLVRGAAASGLGPWPRRRSIHAFRPALSIRKAHMRVITTMTTKATIEMEATTKKATSLPSSSRSTSTPGERVSASQPTVRMFLCPQRFDPQSVPASEADRHYPTPAGAPHPTS